MIPTLSDALAERGYDQLTDVQEAVTEAGLSDSDLLVSAQTGSGKTVGFGLAIAPTLLGDEPRFGPAAAPLSLIIAPTRELAMQVKRELDWLYGKAGGRITSCIGGMDARDERRALERGAHVVVGTPGRLRDHIMRGALDLSDIRAVVLDEADEMLDLGFREDLEYMLGEAPEERRTLMFSATVSGSIAKLAEQYQKDAVRISTVSGKSQHADITYQAVQVTQRDTENAIINLLRFHDAPTAIVFANTRAAVARLTARFANRGFSVVSLSGELSQDERSHALQALRDGRARVCVATDVAARGIDLPNLGLVIHADLPTNTEALLHRSGRTGRAGRKGLSVLIVPDKASKKAERLLKWAKIQAEWTYAPSAEEILASDEARLLTDPAWDEAVSEADTAFALKLLEKHGPEKVAAACLRLFRAGLSAPEVLNKPGEKPERTPRAAFGPSVWFSLSVGRDKGAEARWLLPLLCRVGNLDKDSIGRIRVQDDQSFVELAEASVPEFENMLGGEGHLEKDVFATRVQGEPAFASAPQSRGPRPGGKPGPKPGGKPHRKSPGASGPRPERREADKRPARPKPLDGPKPARSADARPKTPGKPAESKAPYKSASKPAGKPAGKPGGKPAGRPAGKPSGKPAGKPGDRAQKTFGKGPGKPAPAKGGGKGKPSRNADPSQRAKRPVNRSGDAPLRRPPKA